MRKVVRILVRVVAALVVLAALLVTTAYVLVQRRQARQWHVTAPAIAIPDDEAAVARGRRLATVVSVCADCHGTDLGGKVMIDNIAMGRLWATNLTRGRGGIAATYTPADWARTILHGVKPDGRSVVFMPSHEFRFTAAEVGDMAAFFRSLPPVDRQPPAPRIGPMAAVLSYVGMPLLPAELVDHEHVQFATPDATPTTAAETGRQLARKAACTGCHQADFAGGGGPPPGAANLTPVGIGSWTEADFIRAIRQHVRPNGSHIDEAMPLAYGQLSDGELQSLFAFLKTLPPKGEKTKRQM
jgi:mono/diheme cytochrome c family protein